MLCSHHGRLILFGVVCEIKTTYHFPLEYVVYDVGKFNLSFSLSRSGQEFVRSLSDEQKCLYENSRCDTQTDISGILKYTATILGTYALRPEKNVFVCSLITNARKQNSDLDASTDPRHFPKNGLHFCSLRSRAVAKIQTLPPLTRTRL